MPRDEELFTLLLAFREESTRQHESLYKEVNTVKYEIQTLVMPKIHQHDTLFKVLLGAIAFLGLGNVLPLFGIHLPSGK